MCLVLTLSLRMRTELSVALLYARDARGLESSPRLVPSAPACCVSCGRDFDRSLGQVKNSSADMFLHFSLTNWATCSANQQIPDRFLVAS